MRGKRGGAGGLDPSHCHAIEIVVRNRARARAGVAHIAAGEAHLGQIVADIRQRDAAIAGGEYGGGISRQHRARAHLLHQPHGIHIECAAGDDVGNIRGATRADGDGAGAGLVAVILPHHKAAGANRAHRDGAGAAGRQAQRRTRRASGVGDRAATDRKIARGGGDAARQIGIALCLDGHIAAAGGDGVIHLHIAGAAGGRGRERDAARARGQIPRRAEIAIQRAEFQAAGGGGDVLRREHQRGARPQLGRGGGGELAGERIHAQLIGVLQADLRAGGSERYLAVEIIQHAEKINAAAAAVNITRGCQEARPGGLRHPHTLQGDAGGERGIGRGARGIQRVGVEIQHAIGGLDRGGAAGGGVAGEFQTRRARAAQIGDAEVARGHQGAQVVEIGFGERHRARVARQRVGRNAAGGGRLAHRAGKRRTGFTQSHRARRGRHHIQRGIGGVDDRNRTGGVVVGGERARERDVIHPAAAIHANAPAHRGQA